MDTKSCSWTIVVGSLERAGSHGGAAVGAACSTTAPTRQDSVTLYGKTFTADHPVIHRYR